VRQIRDVVWDRFFGWLDLREQESIAVSVSKVIGISDADEQDWDKLSDYYIIYREVRAILGLDRRS